MERIKIGIPNGELMAPVLDYLRDRAGVVVGSDSRPNKFVGVRYLH